MMLKNTKNGKTLTSLALLFIALLFICLPSHANDLAVKHFHKQKLSSKEATQLCVLSADLCHLKKPLIIRNKKANELWLLQNNNIMRFSQLKQLILVNQWDLSDYVKKENEISNYNGAEILPILWLMDTHRYAIATIDTYTESYSGGGWVGNYISFLELQNNGNTEQFINYYYYRNGKLIKACFRQDQLPNAKGKCHDEYSLDLSITPIKPMYWRFQYTYTTDISPVSDSEEKSGTWRKSFLINLNKPPKRIELLNDWDFGGVEDYSEIDQSSEE